MSVVLATAWAALVATGVMQLRPLPPAREARPVGIGGLGVAWRDALTPARVGAGAAVLLAAFVLPPLGLALLGFLAARPALQQRRARARRERAVARDVGDVVTLVGLAVNSGHNLLGALRAAGAHANGPVADALCALVASVDHGVRLADALEPLPDDLGEVVRPMVVALVSCDRYGAPLGPTLDRLAADMRIASRQRAEAAARRLPIRLLFPLVSCILPAFGLLTVAPLIAGSLRGLAL